MEYLTLDERLRLLLAGRAKHPWGESLGMSAGMVDRLFRGQLPGPSVLGLISRAENVSLSWLLGGQGMPYLMARYDEDEALAADLRFLTEDEPSWEVTVVHEQAGPARALVLDQPAADVLKGREVRYRRVEVLGGAVGEGTAAAVSALRDRGRAVHLVEVAPAAAQLILAGRAGTWELFGADGHPGLLAARHAAPRQAMEVAEEGAAYRRDPLCDEIQTLTQDQREAVAATVRAFLGR